MNPLVVILSVLALVVVVNWPRGHVLRKLFASIRAGGTDKWSWLFRWLGWDGLLPVGVALVASGIDLAFPKNRTVIAAVAVYGSLAAFFARGIMGMKQILANNCDEEIRGFQFSMLLVGMFTLLFMDAGIIVSHMDNLEPVFATPVDRFMAGVIVLTYLTAMAFAMYPGLVRDNNDSIK
jgi:hypothetical protein